MIKKNLTQIAFLGPKGSYSDIAATKYSKNFLKKKIKKYSCQKFSDIFEAVKTNQAEYGILPVENSNSGEINEVYKLLSTTNLTLIDEIYIPIKHCILVNKKTILNQIETIYSHIQPVQQCSRFLKNFPKWKIILCNSSSAAIKKVSKIHNTAAALGSLHGGLLYNMNPLFFKKNLSNYHNNITKFIVLKNQTLNIYDKNNTNKKTILITQIDNSPQTLYEILKILKKFNIKIINLKKQKNSLNKENNTIFIEIKINLYNLLTKRILNEINQIAHASKILGCY